MYIYVYYILYILYYILYIFIFLAVQLNLNGYWYSVFLFSLTILLMKYVTIRKRIKSYTQKTKLIVLGKRPLRHTHNHMRRMSMLC